MPTLRDTALAESLAELHQLYAPMNIGTPEPGYCRLTSRRGLCNQRELHYIGENTCPICHGTVHENTLPNDTARLFQKSYAAMKQHEVAAHEPAPKAPVEIKIATPAEDLARYTDNSRVAREINEEAAKVNQRLYGPPSAGA